MGESMSKRLKLQLGGEAEMEERAFSNPYSDYHQPHGATASPAAATPNPEENQRDRSPSPPGDEDSLPFERNGKVSRRAAARLQASGRAFQNGWPLAF
uniref:Uncharacterized protein n=1 Tax=Sphenodon punctatus TaxID=8508 RepID=A0A8D0G8R8_SPHPU